MVYYQAILVSGVDRWFRLIYPRALGSGVFFFTALVIISPEAKRCRCWHVSVHLTKTMWSRHSLPLLYQLFPNLYFRHVGLFIFKLPAAVLHSDVDISSFAVSLEYEAVVSSYIAKCFMVLLAIYNLLHSSGCQLALSLFITPNTTVK